MFSIPGLKVISLTDAAAARIREIMAQSSGGDAPALGLRVGVKKGGCAGMEYTFEIARALSKGDEVVTDKDATVVVDAKAVLFLLGTELDFKTDRFWPYVRAACLAESAFMTAMPCSGCQPLAVFI